jgi:uncharacterized membrane protein YoaK (UPF0700 family)
MKHLTFLLALSLLTDRVFGIFDLFQSTKLPSTPDGQLRNVAVADRKTKRRLLSTTASVMKNEPGILAILRSSRAGSRRARRFAPVPELSVEQISTNTTTRTIGTKTAVTFGVLLALNSGIVNGVCLSGLLSADGTRQSSVAVTGAWTNSALAAASSNYEVFMLNTKCILSYIAGSFISGFLNPNPKPFEVSVGPMQTAFIVGSMLMYGSSVLSEEPDKVFIFLATMASGIQNSLTSTTTANLVRSAHYSGMTSDMGTFLGQIVRGNMENLMKLKTFLSLAIAFWTGGYASYSLAKNYGKHVLMFSSILYLVLALAVGNL